MTKQSDIDDIATGCATMFGCMWLVWAGLIFSIVTAVAIILWKIVFGG